MYADKEKIAVVLPNHLGDVVMATPALRALRKGRPDAEIIGVVRRELGTLLRGLPYVDRLALHDFYKRSPLARVWAQVRFARSLQGADVAVVLTNSWSGALLARLSGAPIRVGYDRRRRSWLLTERVPAPRGGTTGRKFTPVAMERYYLDLVQAFGCADEGTALELALEGEAERECDAMFERHGVDADRPLVCLAPGAGYGPAKLWPVEHVAKLSRQLLDTGAQVALVHGPGEEPLAEEIVTATGPGILSLGGAAMGLALLKSVLARASLLVCNDAGARHVAAAFGTRALVLMGPTSLAYTNLNLSQTRILREPVECSPCQLRVCPIDHRCMQRLSPESVFEQARQALHDPQWLGDGAA